MKNEKKTGNTQMTQIENSLSLDDKVSLLFGYKNWDS